MAKRGVPMNKITKPSALQILGKNIKNIRLLRGFSQESLACELQKSVNFVSLIERGESGLSINSIVDICKVLEVDANTIFDGIIPKVELETDDFINQSLSMFNNNDKAMILELINYIINSKK